MRVGLISDAHANVFALRAVIDDLRDAGVDEILFAGDAIGYHRFVNETVDLLRASRVHGVRGNHEAMLFGDLPATGEARRQYALDYTAQVIRADNREWLQALPASLEITLDGVRFALFHGSPWEPLSEYVYPDYSTFDRFAALPAGIVVLGHTHRQLQRTIGDVEIVNPGSVGLPRDGDDRASYALVDTTTGAIVHGRTSYDRGALVGRPEA